MRIVVIGTGRLASNLVPALQKVGHEVRVVNSRTLEGLPNEADAFVIAVKDDALESVARRVVQGIGFQRYRSPLWCFLSHAKFFEGTTSGFCRCAHIP